MTRPAGSTGHYQHASAHPSSRQSGPGSSTDVRQAQQKADSRFREPVIDLELARDFIRYVKNFNFESNAEVFVNMVISIAVIGFIAYQALTLMYPSGSKEARPQASKSDKNKKEMVDREVSENMYIDLHEHVKEKEIPYRTIRLGEEDTIKKSQLFYEQMKLRRSVRAFSNRAVPLKVIQNVIKTAGTSPSVGNIQPWRYCIISDDNLKQTIRGVLEADERENFVSREHGASWVVDVSQLQNTWLRPYITDAPYLIVICHEIFKDLSGGQQERMLHSNELSTAISIGILLTALQNIGLCGVVTSPLNTGPDICRLLKRPANETVSLLLPVGYPADDALVPDLKRKPIEDITQLY